VKDFLGRLALRVLDLVPVAEPRVTSRFEPAPAMPLRLLHSDGQAETAVSENDPLLTIRNESSSTFRPGRPEPGSVVRFLEHPTPKPPSALPPTTLQPPTAAGVPERPPAAERPGAPLAPSSIALRPSATPPSAAASVSSLEPPSRQPAAPEVVAPPLRSQITRVAPPDERQTERPATIALVRASGWSGTAMPPIPRSESTATLREHKVGGLPFDASPRLLPKIIREPAPARRGSPPRDEATTVQVTIGRVEVRAASPSPPRRPERVPSPILTLDQYLRRREGSGRE
jgi:hypothetical protein